MQKETATTSKRHLKSYKRTDLVIGMFFFTTYLYKFVILIHCFTCYNHSGMQHSIYRNREICVDGINSNSFTVKCRDITFLTSLKNK